MENNWFQRGLTFDPKTHPKKTDQGFVE